jgi:hypothetical protein
VERRTEEFIRKRGDKLHKIIGKIKLDVIEGTEETERNA